MNTKTSDLELIRCVRDGDASPERWAELEARLRGDAAFRDAYVRYANLEVALESSAGAVEAGPAPAPASFAAGGAWARWFRGWARPAIAGMAAGLVSASVVWAVAMPQRVDVRVPIRTLLDERFESGVPASLPGLPRDCGVWSGDEAVVVEEEQGVKPRSGTRMLRFLSASYAGDYAPGNQWSDVYRLVDLRGIAREGHEQVRLTARFAQVPVAADEQYACSVEAIALEHDPGAPPLRLALPRALENGSVAGARTVPLAGDRQWQEVSVDVPLSPETRFVLLHVAATRTSPAVESGPVRFRGHYMDDVKLELVGRR